MSCNVNTKAACKPLITSPVCYKTGTGSVAQGIKEIAFDCALADPIGVVTIKDANGVAVVGAVEVACPPMVFVSNFNSIGGGTSGGTPSDPCCPATNALLTSINTNLSSIAGNTDQIEALQTNTTNAVNALSAYVDQVELLLTSLGTNTDGIEALLSSLGLQTDELEPLLTQIRDRLVQVTDCNGATALSVFDTCVKASVDALGLLVAAGNNTLTAIKGDTGAIATNTGNTATNTAATTAAVTLLDNHLLLTKGQHSIVVDGCAAGVYVPERTTVTYSEQTGAVTGTVTEYKVGAAWITAAPTGWVRGECPAAPAAAPLERTATIISGGANIAAGVYANGNPNSYDPDGNGGGWVPAGQGTLQSFTVTAVKGNSSPAGANRVVVNLGAAGLRFYLTEEFPSYTWSVSQDDGYTRESLDSAITVRCEGDSAAAVTWTEQV